jgi:hypothetical protein
MLRQKMRINTPVMQQMIAVSSGLSLASLASPCSCCCALSQACCTADGPFDVAAGRCSGGAAGMSLASWKTRCDGRPFLRTASLPPTCGGKGGDREGGGCGEAVAAAEAAAAHLLDEPAALVCAVAEAGVVVSPGGLLRIKTRRLLLLLGLAHRAALMGRAATKT